MPIALILVVIYLWWLNGRNLRTARSALSRVAEAEKLWKSATERVVLLETHLQSVLKTNKEYRDIEQQMIGNAIAREDRAILAVEVVLRVNGCTVEQIGQVVDQIRDGGD